MILYHGSNVTVSEPKLVEQNRYLDKVKKLYDQLVFTSEKALGYIKFIGTVPEEEF